MFSSLYHAGFAGSRSALAGSRSTTVGFSKVQDANSRRPALRASASLDDAFKRTVDVAFAASALVLFSPLFLALAALVRFGPEGGPVLFGHKRVGRNGRMFMCYKFRTMAVDGQERLNALLASDPAARGEWERDFKLRADPRVTRIGHTLRKLSLDELPQLLNVIRGDMSIVGPRPVVAAELNRYGRSANHYLRMRPGLTGLWQVSGRNDTSYRRRVAFDRHYARSRTITRDLAIMARTVPVVCFARGSY